MRKIKFILILVCIWLLAMSFSPHDIEISNSGNGKKNTLYEIGRSFSGSTEILVPNMAD